MKLETVRATLESARADVEAEDDRMKVLDGKLNTLATFSGLSVSISASLGANVLASGGLSSAYSIALGLALTVAALLLFLTAITAFQGLRPKEYKGLTLDAARSRVTPRRLGEEPEMALAIMASTYYTDVLPSARAANGVKLDKVSKAFQYARLGLIGLIVSILVTTLGSVESQKDTNGRDSAGCEITTAGSASFRGDPEQSGSSRAGRCN